MTKEEKKGVIWIAIILLGVTGFIGLKMGYRYLEEKNDEKKWIIHCSVETRNNLLDICGLIDFFESYKNESVPIKKVELIEWLEKRAPSPSFLRSCINYEQKTMKDAWGRDIVILSEEGKLIGFGSAGLNGIWENGTGDDIVHTLEQARKNASAP